MAGFAEWDSFYVIVASAAGALIGLQFVVMTLIAERPPARLAEGSAAFATPTIIHFSAVLLLSALVRAPWRAAATPATLCGALGAAGFIYVLIVIGRMRRQTVYDPILEDWIFHAILPAAAYGLMAAAGFLARADSRKALFGIGGAVLLLLFVGIHNAWDAAAYHIASGRKDEE
jgi:hypothetical protein